jgi:plasmid maintenance system killer protein
MRINDQYRLIFRFEKGDAYDVYIEGQDHTGRR